MNDLDNLLNEIEEKLKLRPGSQINDIYENS